MRQSPCSPEHVCWEGEGPSDGFPQPFGWGGWQMGRPRALLACTGWYSAASQQHRRASPSYCQDTSDSTQTSLTGWWGDWKSGPSGSTGLGSGAGLAVLDVDHPGIRISPSLPFPGMIDIATFESRAQLPWSLHSVSDVQLLLLPTNERIKA